MGLRKLFGGGSKDETPQPPAPPPGFGQQQQAQPPQDVPSRGMVLVRSPNGVEIRQPMGAKPITIGRWEQCDITIDDEALRPVHVRVTAVADGEFRVHGVAAPTLRPFATNIARPDEFMLTNSGDQVTLPGSEGDHVIHFLSTEAVAALADPEAGAADDTAAAAPETAAPAPAAPPPDPAPDAPPSPQPADPSPPPSS